MTKAQREEKARNERKLQQMLAAGIKVNALEGEEPKKKPVYDDKKKKAANKKVSFLGVFFLLFFLFLTMIRYGQR